jgi:hypothetical protein
MITITKRPERFHKKYDDRFSRWNCSRHPYLFEFLRQDIVVSSVVNLNGNIAFSISLFQHPDALQIAQGEQVYFSALDGVFNVLSSQTAFFFQVIEIDASFDPNITSGFLNLLKRNNYFIEIKLRGLNAIGNQDDVSFGTARITPNTQGVAKFDAQNFLNNFVSKENLFEYDVLSWRDPACYGSFEFSFREVYRDSNNVELNDKTKYFFIDATKYLLEDYGQNLCDFTPFNLNVNNYDTILVQRAKFLCDFERPTYFVGYPFSLSYINTGEIARSLNAHETKRNEQNAVISTTSTDLTQFFDVDGVYRLTLQESANATPYANTSVVEVWLRISNVVAQRYAVEGYVEAGYSQNVSSPAIATGQDVTEHKFVKIVRPCGTSPIYLCWRNSKGGFSYWLFENKQEVEYQSSQDGTFIDEGDDLEVSNRRKTIFQANQSKVLSLGGVVSLEDFNGIRTIYQSPNVLLLVDQSKLATEPERAWLSVRPIPKSLKHFTTADTIEFEIQVELPAYYTIQN